MKGPPKTTVNPPSKCKPVDCLSGTKKKTKQDTATLLKVVGLTVLASKPGKSVFVLLL